MPAEGGLAYDAFALLAPFVVPAERAEPGTAGLFSYPAGAWEDFAGGASEVGGVPDVEVALAGFPAPGSDRVIVVPDIATEERVSAFWLATEDDGLEVVVAETGEHESAFGLFDRLGELMRLRGRRQERQSRCTYRRSRLACAERDCSSGECGIESWYDEGCRSRLYACVCQEG